MMLTWPQDAYLKPCDGLKLPPLWLKRWQNTDPFWHVFHLQGTVYREQPGRKTLRFIEDNEPFFVKCHSGVGWKEIFKNLLQGRLPIIGAKNEFFAIQHLEKFGFVPKVIGFGWRGKNPANQQSFLITKELSFTISLEEFCRDWLIDPPPLNLKRALIHKIATMARTIHEHGINHRDFYLCHFLLDVTGGTELLNPQELNIYLIDLHRAQIRKKVPWRWRVKDIAGLYFSAMEIGLTPRDLARFMITYNTGKPVRFWQAVHKRAIKLYRKIWRQLPHGIHLPFNLTLENHQSLYAKHLLRCLPYKRLTVVGECNNQDIIAKLFVQHRHAQLEIHHHAILKNNGFSTPTLHYHGWSQHHALYVLIYHYHRHAISLQQLFDGISLEEKHDWMKKLIALITQQHEKGIWQADCHLGNFLVDNDELLTIDLGSIRIQQHPLRSDQREKNLAFLFAQFSPNQSALWQPYASSSIQILVKKVRRKLLHKYLGKAQRNCTTYRCESSKNYNLILNRQFDNNDTRQLLHTLKGKESSQTSQIINASDKNIYTYLHSTPKDFLNSPARREWLKIHRQLFNHATTIVPIALLEKKSCGLKTQSYLIVCNK
jgi:heptose I phosphotransferase